MRRRRKCGIRWWRSRRYRRRKNCCFDRAVCGADRSLGPATAVEIWRDGEPGTIERAQSVWKHSATAFAWLLRFREGTVFVDGVTWEKDAAGRHDVVSAHHVAGGVLASVVGLHHS